MTELVIHAREVDEPAMAQIRDIASHPAVDGLVAIMPDCHLGAGCVIGFTGRFKGAVIPNVVGVDIGCGVLLAPLEGVKKGDVDFAALDGFIRGSIPLGKTRHRSTAMIDWFESRFPAGEPGQENWGSSPMRISTGSSSAGGRRARHGASLGPSGAGITLSRSMKTPKGRYSSLCTPAAAISASKWPVFSRTWQGAIRRRPGLPAACPAAWSTFPSTRGGTST